MKTSEENVKKERKPHGAIFWLIWTLVVGSIFGLCVGAVATFEEEYHGYESKNYFRKQMINSQLRAYSVYALSDYQDDFRQKELDQTNFRYAIYTTDGEETVDLTDRRTYLVCTLSDQQLENALDLYSYSATIGEYSQIDYDIETFWRSYGYIRSHVSSYDYYNYRAENGGSSEAQEPEGTDYYVLAAVADTPNLTNGDLIAQTLKAVDIIYDLRFVPVVIGVITGVLFFLFLVFFCKAFFRFIGRCWNGLAFQWRGRVPLFWRLVGICAGVLSLELIIVLMCVSENAEELIAFAWAIQSLLLAAVFLFTGLQLRRLTEGAKRLAAGDLTSKVDTRQMLFDLRVIGESLNTTGEGMEKAVEDRMKSEHFKTELISNVSHDIKTPLTSIISYVELLKAQPEEEPANREYLETLERQSVRLKKLLEDLIEASKASTGNLKADLQACDVNTVLSQILGEYEEKLSAQEIDLRIRMPEERVTILADTQHLQRVLDNLLVNISKYSQPGTRAYVNLEASEGEARIELKNTSREPLNLTSDELLERFTRGDSSRGSEGNGLGLSIAQSLTELMKGNLDLVVDGDLFKVILRFPRVAPADL